MEGVPYVTHQYSDSGKDKEVITIKWIEPMTPTWVRDASTPNDKQPREDVPQKPSNVLANDLN
jgi:hypothetical protein